MYDGGMYDGGMYDGGMYDGGMYDGGMYDGGMYDGGMYDGGMYDGGMYDGGMYDGGMYDGGMYDGGMAVRWQILPRGWQNEYIHESQDNGAKGGHDTNMPDTKDVGKCNGAGDAQQHCSENQQYNK